MKLRTGFVSNSSSSAFIIAFDRKMLTEKIKESLWESYVEHIESDWHWENNFGNWRETHAPEREKFEEILESIIKDFEEDGVVYDDGDYDFGFACIQSLVEELPNIKITEIDIPSGCYCYYNIFSKESKTKLIRIMAGQYEN